MPSWYLLMPVKCNELWSISESGWHTPCWIILEVDKINIYKNYGIDACTNKLNAD